MQLANIAARLMKPFANSGNKAAIPQTGTDPFPPRERGWSLLRSFAEPQVLVSPARAGMVPPWHSCTKKR